MILYLLAAPESEINKSECINLLTSAPQSQFCLESKFSTCSALVRENLRNGCMAVTQFVYFQLFPSVGVFAIFSKPAYQYNIVTNV